jgi:hypothetical protein
MLNGELDVVINVKKQAEPLFALLGTSPEDKKYIIAPGGHFVPRELLIRETLDWLDKYVSAERQQMITGPRQ